MRRIASPLSFSVSAVVIIAPPIGGCTPAAVDAIINSGDSNDETESVVEVNTVPVAAAGSDQTVVSGALVVLNASDTVDPDGDRLQFIWGQTAGTPSVVLQDGFSSAPRFFAPTVSAPTTLTFRLTVGDGQAISTDDVKVTITP
jgi:hypothetical protein